MLWSTSRPRGTDMNCEGLSPDLALSQRLNCRSGLRVRISSCATRHSRRGLLCIRSCLGRGDIGVCLQRRALRYQELTGGYTDLEIIAVDPKFQGQGVGSLMLDWGTTRADSDSCEAYLEASPDAVSVYQKFGFKETGSTDTWIENERVAGVRYRNLFMVRPAKTQTS